MTVTYSADVATSSLACFLRLLLRWRGSIYKLMWKEFVIFFGMYYFLGVLYQFVFLPHQTAKYVFERIVLYCQAFSDLIPVAFILGFYINAVNSRWWNQFCSIPWPDRTALYVAAHISETSDRARLIRRTIMRYVNLSITMTMVAVSPRAKKRFPTTTHLTEAGILLPHEEEILETIPTLYNKYFVPLAWTMNLMTCCRKEGLIDNDFALKTLLDEVTSIRSSLGMVFGYDWIPVPLVYTQVVTLAVHMFVLSTIFGNQTIESTTGQSRTKEFFFPLFTFLQFFFYMGWLKVAEQMVNPFGEDDDDFDINTLLDRNMKVAYLLVDEIRAQQPELMRDMYWDVADFDLPYTKDTQRQSIISNYFHGSAYKILIKAEAAAFLPRLITVRESMEEDKNAKGKVAERPESNLYLDSESLNLPPQHVELTPLPGEVEKGKTASNNSTSRRLLLQRKQSGPTSLQDTRNRNNSNIRRLKCTSRRNARGGTRMPKAMNHPMGGLDNGEYHQQPRDFQPCQHKFQQHHEKTLQNIRSSRCRRKSGQSLLDEARAGNPLRRASENESVFVETNVTYV